MSKFYLINTTVVNNMKVLPGTLIDDTVTNAAEIVAAGGLLWPVGDPIIDEAALRAQIQKGRGSNEDDLESIMQTAVNRRQMLNESGMDLYTQDDVYINADTGSDNKDGASPANALKTHKELARRVRNKVIQPAGAVLNVYILTNLPSSDPIEFDMSLGVGVGVVYRGGYGTPLRTGTLSLGTTDKDISINQAFEITDSGLAGSDDFDDYRFQLVTITGGAGLGSQAWIADSEATDPSLAAKTARMSEWFAPFDSGDPIQFSAPSDPPTATSTYRVESLRQATMSANCTARTPWLVPTDATFVPYVSFVDFEFVGTPDTGLVCGSFANDNFFSVFNYARCKFSDGFMGVTKSFQLTNCLLGGGFSLVHSTAPTFILGGLSTAELQNDSQNFFTSQTMFLARLLNFGGSLYFGDIGLFGPDTDFDMGDAAFGRNIDFIFGGSGQLWGKLESRSVLLDNGNCSLHLRYLSFGSPTYATDPIIVPFVETTSAADFNTLFRNLIPSSSVYSAGVWTDGIDNKWAKFLLAAPAGYLAATEVGVGVVRHFACATEPNQNCNLSIFDFKFA